MWLRHALKLLLTICILSACSSPDRQAVDKLNSFSYAYHYRNLDSTEYFARKALSISEGYRNGQAEALNNLAFVSIARMHYAQAQEQLDSIAYLTDNQLELLVADIQLMRLCQRRSANREFYDYREQALKTLRRIDEERLSLNDRQLARLRYAESELSIVTSTYYYYVGLEKQSVEELLKIDFDIERDTAQWLNYLYNVGAGGMITEGDVEQQELDYLYECLMLSQQFGSPYFKANALEGIAEHLIADDSTDDPDSQPLLLASESLNDFIDYGDIYQIAGAYRTLAACYRVQGNYQLAIENLEQALSDSAIFQAPDLVASIREQLSVVYSAIDDKMRSDENRNLYLDLQEQTRQDRSLEARAGQLDAAVAQLNMLLVAVFVALLLFVLSLRLFYLYYRRHHRQQEELGELRQQREEVEEEQAISKLKLQEGERRNLNQRAKLAFVNSITPLIDRMLHDVKLIASDDAHREERLQYVSELTDTINEQNDVLTQWIQLRKGELNLHIETFSVQSLFDIIEKSRRSFTLKGIKLIVEPTDARVKADRVLTLFMLNTLADNARKFTGEGGEVRLSAEASDKYVELSVTDSGRGMNEEELAHVFDHKVANGHGFGLLNCRGIIEKYRKTSNLFSVCQLSVQSTKGQGSRFFFRLPVPSVLLIVSLLFFSPLQPVSLSAASVREPSLAHAATYADSAYASNIAGTYENTLEWADSCLISLNTFYKTKHQSDNDTLMLFAPSGAYIPEIDWLHRDIAIDYNVLLSLRNEVAVAALALHEWSLYHYNNRIFTLLFKELSADRTLDEYCRRMQQAQNDRMVAIILLVLIGIALFIAIIFQLFQALGRKATRKQQQQSSLDMLRDDIRRMELEEARLHISSQIMDNCLSTLKHETMYYPSRIRQLIETGDTSALTEVVEYYRELYGILSQQAVSESASIHLHLKPLEHNILGDENLINYLFDILRKQTRQKVLEISYELRDEQYVVCKVEMPDVAPTNFLPAIDNIPYLVCRQIVREHGEATGLHACGITSEATSIGSRIIITLPKQIWRNSK